VGYQAIDLFGNQAVYGVPQEYWEQEFSAFNSKFEQYKGSVKGSSVKSLLHTIISHNNAYMDEYDKIVAFNGISSEQELVNIRTTIKTGRKYNISLEYKEGYVKNIICEEVQQ